MEENRTNGIYSNENHSNKNQSNFNKCIDAIMSEPCKIYSHDLKVPADVKELSAFDLSSQIKEFEEVKVKTEPNVLENDLHPSELITFTCQTDTDIKQDSKDEKTEMFQGITSNMKEDTTSNCDRLQTKLISELVEEDEKVQTDLPASIPLITEDKEEALSSEVKFPVIASNQLLVPKMEQFVLTNRDNSKCILVLTDIEKQNRKCPKGTAIMMKSSTLNTLYKCPKYNCNFSELVPPYNCEDDGFPSCLFKTLYFDEYLKHVEVIHQIDGLSSFSSEHELLRGTIMEGWLAKEVGPFQCRYCKKATVTHQEMGRHQAMFHTLEQCLFFYRKFIPNDTVTIPEHVNLEDPSFINHVIHLPDQAHLCDFKLTDGPLSLTSAKVMDGAFEVSQPLLPQPPSRDPEDDLDQLEVPHDEPEIFNMPTDHESSLLSELDPLCLDEKLPKNGGTHDDAIHTVQLAGEALQKPIGKKLQCKWKGCYQTYDFQTALVKHIKKNHVQSQSEEFTCFWKNCPRKFKPYNWRCDLLLHIRIHSGEKPYKCAFQGCNKAFSRPRNLAIHQRGHTGERPYQCQYPDCFKRFSTIHDKDNHQKLHYNPEAYACPVTGCSKKYSYPNNLGKHMKIHTVDEQLQTKRKLVENKEKESDLVLKETSYSSNGDKHQRTHYDNLQCKWNGCYQTFDFQTGLVKHIKKNHVLLQSDKELTCLWNNCPRKLKPYNWRCDLLLHMNTHSGEKPYKCAFQGCNKAFSQPRYLTVHQKGHTGERPYQCQYSNCFKKFGTVYDKNYHQRLHYNPKAFACQVTGCSKEYTHPSNLRKHMKIHTVDEQLETKRKLDENKEKEGDFVLKK